MNKTYHGIIKIDPNKEYIEYKDIPYWAPRRLPVLQVVEASDQKQRMICEIEHLLEDLRSALMKAVDRECPAFNDGCECTDTSSLEQFKSIIITENPTSWPKDGSLFVLKKDGRWFLCDYEVYPFIGSAVTSHNVSEEVHWGMLELIGCEWRLIEQIRTPIFTEKSKEES